MHTNLIVKSTDSNGISNPQTSFKNIQDFALICVNHNSKSFIGVYETGIYHADSSYSTFVLGK